MATFVIGPSGDYTTVALWYAARRLSITDGETETLVFTAGDHDVEGTFDTWATVDMTIVLKGQTSHGGQFGGGARLYWNTAHSNWKWTHTAAIELRLEDVELESRGNGKYWFVQHLPPHTDGGDASFTTKHLRCLHSEKVSIYVFEIYEPILYTTDNGQSVGDGGTQTKVGNASTIYENCVFAMDSCAGGVFHWSRDSLNASLNGVFANLTTTWKSCTIKTSQRVLSMRSQAAPTWDVNVLGCLVDDGQRFIYIRGTGTYTSTVTDLVTTERNNGDQLLYWSGGVHGTQTNVLADVDFYYDDNWRDGAVSFFGLKDLRLTDDARNVAVDHVQNVTVPTTDITGRARGGSYPDAGAFERVDVELDLLIGTQANLYEDQHNKIRTRFNAGMVSTNILPIAVFDNEREAPTGDAIWCEVNIVDEDTELVAHGGQQTFRKRGVLRVRIHGPLQRGDATMLGKADAVRSFFNRVIADGVHYGATSVGSPERRGQYYSLLCETPFYLDDTQARPDNVGSWSLVDREAAANSIRSRFDGLFGPSGTIDPHTVVYDNAPTKPPLDAQWILFSILTGTTEAIGAGVNAWARTPGLATAMICTPLGQGNQDALYLADRICQRFRSLTDNGVVYETPYVLTAGRREQWWQTNVNLRFRLEEILP